MQRARVALAFAALVGGEECFMSPPAFPPQEATVRLMARNWPSHQLVTEVAAILLREQLKFDVEVVAPSSVPLDDYQHLARGEFDANLEVWPAGKEGEYARWVEQGSAVSLGEHSVVSVEGMYVPRYIVDQDWTASFFRSLQQPSAQERFSQVTRSEGLASADPDGLCTDPAWNCSNYVWRPPYCADTSCRAQLLHGPVSYTQGQMEQQIAGNGLNFSVAYLPLDKLKDQVWEAYARGKPFLFHHWEPREAVHGLDASHFTRVRFAPIDEGCAAAKSNATPAGGNACDAPLQSLQKVVSKKLADQDDAFYLVKSLSLDQTDYEALFSEYEVANHDVRKAACRWLHRTGKDRWGKWLQYSRQGPSMPEPKLGGCWLYVWSQALVLLIGSISYKSFVFFRSLCRRLVANREEPDIEQGSSGQHKDKKSEGFKDTMKSGKLGFLTSTRKEKDFLSFDGKRCNAVLPQGYASFRIQNGSTSKRQLIWYAVESSMNKTMAVSFKFACVIGMLGSFVHIAKEHALVWNTQSFLEGFVEPFARVVKDFGMLPAFMVALSVNATVSNWMTWLGYAGSAYGRVCDTALIIGGLEGMEDEHREDWQSITFRFYRYLNAVHYLCYHTVDPRVGNDPVAICRDLSQAGLLTDQEAAHLGLSVEMHSTILIWLACLWDEQVAPRLSPSQRHKTQNFQEQITSLRTAIGSTKAQVDFGPPDITRGMLYAVTCTLLAFILLSYPLTMYVPGQCFQWGTMLCGTLYIFCYHGLLTMGDTLNKGPFDPECDCVNSDHLLCWAELTVYQMLQASRYFPKVDNSSEPLERKISHVSEHEVLGAQEHEALDLQTMSFRASCLLNAKLVQMGETNPQPLAGLPALSQAAMSRQTEFIKDATLE